MIQSHFDSRGPCLLRKRVLESARVREMHKTSDGVGGGEGISVSQNECDYCGGAALRTKATGSTRWSFQI